LIGYLQENNLREQQNVRIEWDELQRYMYVSVSLSKTSPLYEQCFVLYPPLDKWGQFNEAHYGIFPLKIQGSARADDYYGFADSDGAIRYWKNTGARQKATSNSTSLANANLHQPATQRPIVGTDGEESRTGSTSAKLNTFPRTSPNLPADYYVAASMSPVAAELKPLNSVLRVGLFRPTGETVADQVSEIVGVLIRSLQSGDESQVAVDFNTIPPATADEDYNIGVGTDDYGINVLNYVNHKLDIISTLDGGQEFLRVTPDIVAFVQGARYYSCSTVGVWHIVEVRADEVGESFHINTLELVSTSAGRLL
jgi:hypothetical protein